MPKMEAHYTYLDLSTKHTITHSHMKYTPPQPTENSPIKVTPRISI